MTSPATAERYHALDATRAFALLLGVVFHAAWSFVPAPIGAPRVDASGSVGFDWFFFTSHTFRMQLFFLIAGFFARLVCDRRGIRSFLGNRLVRIGVPLVVGWVILHPLVLAAFFTGGNLSGRLQTPIPMPVLFQLMYGMGLAVVPQNLGGLFTLAHLWFLYYLVLIYAGVLTLRFLATRSPSLAGGLRRLADNGIARCLRSPWSLPVLTAGMAVFLWPMKGWFGVDTPAGTPVPSVVVLIFYGSFFVLGWLLHRQPGLLTGLGRHGRWQVALGLLLSVPVFLSYRSARQEGIAGSINANYPGLEANQIVAWPAFLRTLQSAASPDAPAELVNLWSHLRPTDRQAILGLSAEATPDQRAGVARTLSPLLFQPALFLTNGIPRGYRPPVAEARAAQVANRTRLEQLFPNSLAGDPRKAPGYALRKLLHSAGYSLVMWLLIFGTLGTFQARFPDHSPAWRYVADSSYWIYLAHLPLVAALQVWMAPWAAPGILKFALLNAIAIVLLFASYHYLVRSTFIGQVLNGRRYPFRASPFGKPAGGTTPS